MKVKIKKLSSEAQMPCKGTLGAAAYDLYSTEKVYIPPGETVAVGTGLSMEIPKGWRGDIYSRSGMASQGVVVANSPGKIDSDYRGEIMVLLHNNRRSYVAVIEVGDKIAQFEISQVQLIQFEEIEELSITERGSDGFGSTGK
jgi:dUTP pyrophosphatase|tara:strand:- start:2805 stop:3233 length:429 start_codon:yes stop_codon:yes gene_type:complete